MQGKKSRAMLSVTCQHSLRATTWCKVSEVGCLYTKRGRQLGVHSKCNEIFLSF